MVDKIAKPVDKPGQVIIKIKRIGICGTDIHAFGGNQPFFEYPRVLGHELSGVVESVGDDVALQPGQNVYVIPYMHCDKCVACRQGKTNCCTDIQVLGVHVDGGMCEYLQVPQQYVIAAQGLELDQLAVVECLAIGAHAVRRANIAAGSNVLVVGAGPIGMGIMQFAKVSGANVLVMDMSEQRLEFANNELGIEQVIKAGADAKAAISKLTDGDFMDVVFDATGNPKAMEAGFELVAHAGTYVLVSVVKADICFADPEFHKREMSLLGSRNATREDFEQVVSCIEDGSVKVHAMITHKGALVDLPELFPKWCDPQSGVIKAVVEV